MALVPQVPSPLRPRRTKTLDEMSDHDIDLALRHLATHARGARENAETNALLDEKLARAHARDREIVAALPPPRTR